MRHEMIVLTHQCLKGCSDERTLSQFFCWEVPQLYPAAHTCIDLCRGEGCVCVCVCVCVCDQLIRVCPINQVSDGIVGHLIKKLH